MFLLILTRNQAPQEMTMFCHARILVKLNRLLWNTILSFCIIRTEARKRLDFTGLLQFRIADMYRRFLWTAERSAILIIPIYLPQLFRMKNMK